MISRLLRHPFHTLILAATTILLLGCSTGGFSQQQQSEPQTGRILLWHTWTGEEGVALDSMLAAYSEINPGIEVISVQIEEGSFVKRFLDRNEGGLGPDLVLASSNIIYQLAEKRQIRDLAPLEKDLTTYLSTSLGTVSDGERLFALPFSGSTRVLFYNRSLVVTPPETIAELLERTAEGEVFAQSTNFVESYWGVGAYDLAWIEDAKIKGKVAAELRLRIWDALRANGVEIPYPQQDLHIRSGLPEFVSGPQAAPEANGESVA